MSLRTNARTSEKCRTTPTICRCSGKGGSWTGIVRNTSIDSFFILPLVPLALRRISRRTCADWRHSASHSGSALGAGIHSQRRSGRVRFSKSEVTRALEPTSSEVFERLTRMVFARSRLLAASVDSGGNALFAPGFKLFPLTAPRVRIPISPSRAGRSSPGKLRPADIETKRSPSWAACQAVAFLTMQAPKGAQQSLPAPRSTRSQAIRSLSVWKRYRSSVLLQGCPHILRY